MAHQLTIKSINRLVKLLNDYPAKETECSPNEFIEIQIEQSVISKKSVEMFLKVMKHRTMLKKIVKNYCQVSKSHSDRLSYVVILFYLVLFELNANTFNSVEYFFAHGGYKQSYKIIDYFKDDDNLVNITVEACSVFDNGYVLEEILRPLEKKQKMLDSIREAVVKVKGTLPDKKPSTIPRGPCCSYIICKKNDLGPPPEKPYPPFRGQPVPTGMYMETTKEESALAQAFIVNKANAEALLLESRTHAFSCAQPKKIFEPEEFVVEPIRPLRMPKVKEVTYRSNIATVIRQASKIAKEQEAEIKRLENLCNSGFDMKKIDVMVEEIRKENEKNELEAIERKHLEGLLSFEQAVVAKKKLVEDNQVKVDKFIEQRLDLLKKLDEWKKQQEIKIKASVEKTHDIRKACKEAGVRLMKTKRGNAKMVHDDILMRSRRMYEERKAELERKLQIIREIKAIHSLQSAFKSKPKFDPTECANVGLLCEMSLAELQERLVVLRQDIKDELRRKRESVNVSRKNKQDLLESAKNFILEINSNKEKEKIKPKEQVKLEETPELKALRDKYLAARSKRKGLR